MSDQHFDDTEHRKIWVGFMEFTKWGIVSVAVILILMAIFLVDAPK